MLPLPAKRLKSEYLGCCFSDCTVAGLHPDRRSNKTTLQSPAAQDNGEVGSVLLGQDQAEIPGHIFLNLFVCSDTPDSMRITRNVMDHTADCSSSPQLCPQDSCSPSPPVSPLTHLYSHKAKFTPRSDSFLPHAKSFHLQNQLCIGELADEKPCDIRVISERTGNKLKLFPSLPVRSLDLLPVHSPDLLPGTCRPYGAPVGAFQELWLSRIKLLLLCAHWRCNWRCVGVIPPLAHS